MDERVRGGRDKTQELLPVTKMLLRKLSRRAWPLTFPAARGLASRVSDPYAVLGVAPGASADELKAAYRIKAMETHPDRAAEEDREAAEQAFREVTEAFDRASNPNRNIRGPPREDLSKEEAERLFWEIFGADGDVELAWRVPGRRAPIAPKRWQEYQAMLDAGDDEALKSGARARQLYRECMRALRGVDDATADGVREHARSLFADNAHETSAARMRTLLVDGHHSLEELKKCLLTTVAVAPTPPDLAAAAAPAQQSGRVSVTQRRDEEENAEMRVSDVGVSQL